MRVILISFYLKILGRICIAKEHVSSVNKFYSPTFQVSTGQGFEFSLSHTYLCNFFFEVFWHFLINSSKAACYSTCWLLKSLAVQWLSRFGCFVSLLMPRLGHGFLFCSLANLLLLLVLFYVVISLPKFRNEMLFLCRFKLLLVSRDQFFLLFIGFLLTLM